MMKLKIWYEFTEAVNSLIMPFLFQLDFRRHRRHGHIGDALAGLARDGGKQFAIVYTINHGPFVFVLMYVFVLTRIFKKLKI